MNSSQSSDPPFAGARQGNRTQYDNRSGLASKASGLEGRKGEQPDSVQSRAARYEDEKRRIIESCFSNKDSEGAMVESYITHVRVTEDAMYPSLPPPPDSPFQNKKNRVILVAVRRSGRVRLHKARENPNGTFSIGKTWVLDELTSIQVYTGMVPTNSKEQKEKQFASDVGFVVIMGKNYYWQAATAKEKDFFIASLVKIYRKYTGGKLPQLLGFPPPDLDLLAGGQAGKMGADYTSRVPSQTSMPSTPPPPPPIPATSEHRTQSPYTARGPDVDTARRNQQNGPHPQASVEQLRRLPQEPLRSPARAFGRISSQEHLSSRRPSDESYNQSLRPDIPPTRAPDIAQRPLPSVASSLQQREQHPEQRQPPVNGRGSDPRVLTDPSMTGQAVSYSAETMRDRPNNSDVSDKKIPSSSLDAPVASSQSSLVKEPVLEQQRARDREQHINTRRPSNTSEPETRFVTPMTTPGAREQTRKPNLPDEASFPAKATIEEPKADYFGADVAKQQTHSSFHQSITKPNSEGASVQKDAALHTPQGMTDEPEELANANQSDGEHRPGLGPMLKKKSGKDIANQFRKAAFAASAFKPREGGGAARLRALQDKDNKSNEPDGITAVVPAPVLRGMSSDSVKPGLPETPGLFIEKEMASTPPGNFDPPRARLQEADTTNDERPVALLSSTPDPSQSQLPSQPQSPPQPPPQALESTNGQVSDRLSPPERAPSPEKARSRSPQRRKRQRQEAEIEKYCASIGVNSRIFEGRGGDFNDLLTEFGWNGRLTEHRKIDDFESEVRREIGRAQATGWLGHVEQQEGKIQDLAKAFDRAIGECEELDGLFTLYSHELETLASDIEYIEAQSQGLQVQTANQKVLQTELQSLLNTLTIPTNELRALHGGPPETPEGIAAIERALSLLYQALLKIDPNIPHNRKRQADGARADRGGVGIADQEISQMAAVQERREYYKREADEFIHSFASYLKLAVQLLEQRVTEDNSTLAPAASAASLVSPTHQGSRQELWQYSALVLFAREVNKFEWTVMLRNYERTYSSTYLEQFKGLTEAQKHNARKATAEENEALFTTYEKEKSEDSLATTAARKLTVKRGKTVKASALKHVPGDNTVGKSEAWEIFDTVVQQQARLVSEEQNFIVSFFHLNSQANTDFTDMVTARRPQERRLPNLSAKQSYEPDREMAAMIQGAVESIFSFWQKELDGLMSWVLDYDSLQGVGILGALGHSLSRYEDTNQEFITRSLRTLHDHLVILFHKFVDEQVKAIEETKVKVKKRKGIISFMRTFPNFTSLVEGMVPHEGAESDSLEVRFIVNDAYSKILKAMWECLTFIAKDDPATVGGSHTNAGLSGDPEDKEALNYHILLIENMNHYIEEVDTGKNIVLEEWKERATQDMATHLRQYTDSVIRRPLGKWLDFLESTEAMVKTSDSFQGIATKPSHSRSAAKKVLKTYDSGEVRKGIDTLKKRIEKHFGDLDDPTTSSKSLILRVFEECGSRYGQAYDRMKVIIDQVYDGSLEIDWRKEEVVNFFKR